MSFLTCTSTLQIAIVAVTHIHGSMSVVYTGALLLRFTHYDFVCIFFFFFQAEDGIRDYKVTGVQTCCSSDLPRNAAQRGGDILPRRCMSENGRQDQAHRREFVGEVVSNKMQKTVVVVVKRFVRHHRYGKEIGRASCRERV